MNVKRKVKDVLSGKAVINRCLALFLCLSIFVSYGLPLSSLMQARAANESEVVPVGSYEINNDITKIDITLDSNQGTFDSSTNTIQVEDGLDEVNFSMQVDFTIIDESHDKIDTNKHNIYLRVPREQLKIFAMTESGQGVSSDGSIAWRNYVVNNKLGSYASGVFTIYDTGEDDYGFVVLEFNDDYINYLRTSSGVIHGSLEFQGRVERDHRQNGDKTVNLGNVGINVDFDDRTPDLSKTGAISRYDESGCPVITWTINVSDLYETQNYHITDDMLGELVEDSFKCIPDGVCFLENGEIQFNQSINSERNFTITYDTKVTPEQLKAHTSQFDVTNNVKLNDEIKDDATVPIIPDSTPHVSKTGTPDYKYNGDRSGEAADKDYIYWTANVDRNYGISLAGTTIKDTPGNGLSNIELLSAVDENNTFIPLSDLFTSTSGNEWTFKDSIELSHVKLVYRTEVSGDADGLKNDIEVVGGESKTTTVDYNKKAQHSSSKSGVYRIEEAPDGTVTEYIDWTISVETENDSNETVNGYTIKDAAFSSPDFEWKSITAQSKADYSNITIKNDSTDNISQWLTISGDTLTVSGSQTDIRKIDLTYSVPVGNVAGRTATEGGTITNTYKVEDDKPVDAKVNVPNLAGSSNVTVNKNWDNAQDPNKNNTVSRMILYYKVGDSGSWARYQKDNNDYIIEMSGSSDQQVIFTDLPAYEYNESSQSRTPIYYRVEEEVVTPEGVDDLYKKEFTAGSEDGAKASSNPFFSIKNTWEGTGVTGIKQWRDDEGLESARPEAVLTLQKLVNGNWVDVSSKNVGNSSYSSVSWDSLPKYDEDHNEIQYRVYEKDVPAKYKAEYNGNIITNVYDNMTISAEKNWNRIDSDEDKPESVKFKLMRTTDPNNDSSWTDVPDSVKVLSKADYANSAEILKWPDLPKDDGQGNNYYYKVVEIQETEKQQEFEVSYNNNSIQASDWSHRVNVVNTWKKTNISFSKEWQNDNGNDKFRPNLTFTLEKSTDGGNTWTTAKTVKMVNDGTGLYKPEGSTGAGSKDISYTWHNLEAGDNIRYRVVETSMDAIYRTTDSDYVGVETGKPDTGYDVYYNYTDENNRNSPDLISTGSADARNVKVINKSNMMTIRVNKIWNGVYGDSRPDRVGYRLYRWTDEQYNTLSEEEKYTDTYKFSDKYAIKNAAGESDAVYWTWMLVKDENGAPYHYALREIYIGKRTDNGDGPAVYSDNSEYYNDYEIDITDEMQGDTLNVFNVTNTWKKMNVSIRKNWEEGTNVSGYKSISMKLMQKVGENGTWEEVPGAEQKSVTAEDGWHLEDAWKDLPRTNDQGYKIYYRAEEVSAVKTDNSVVAVESSEDFYTRPDANGINSSGESAVTNTPKKIRVDAVKKWVSPRGTAKPENIELTLMASYNGNASWVRADQLEGYTIDAVKTISLNTEDQTTYWDNLPTKYKVGSEERDVIYKVEEKEVTGYSSSIDPEFVSSNSTITITNTENAPYTKKAANPVPSIDTDITYKDIDWWDNQEHFFIEKAACCNGKTLVKENDSILQNNTLSIDDMSTVDTAIVDINGVPTECYLFKWRIDMLTNQTENTGNTAFRFIDRLTDGSVFYDDDRDHGIEIVANNGDASSGAYGGKNTFVYGSHSENSYYYEYRKFLNVTYDSNDTVAIFDMKTPQNGNKVAYITYYTATPKSVVDNAIDQTGGFTLSNFIREDAEPHETEVDLHISGGTDTGIIDKLNKTASGTTSSGKAIMQNGVAHYTLDVNKDSKYMSSGDSVSVTDIFRILRYKPNGGEEQVGRNVQLEPSIENVSVFYYDLDGKRSRVEADQYSYSVTKDENGIHESAPLDYSDKFNNSSIQKYTEALNVQVYTDVPKGLEVIIRFVGNKPNQPAIIDPYNSSIMEKIVDDDGNTDDDLVEVELLSDTFDSSGAILVRIKFLKDIPSGTNIGQLGFTIGDNVKSVIQSCEVISAVLKSRTETIDYITKFTLPDGGHYEIMYDYVIKNPDGTDIASNSSLSLYNQATVHTSGGDKSDESQETEYIVSKSGAQTHAAENFRIIKIDLGNKSLDDLNAEFKLAKYDTETGNWIYADEFPFKKHTLLNGYTYYDEKLHEISYEQGLTETEGIIPDDSANMVLEGSFELELFKDTLYKIIEVKAPDNHEGFKYQEVPYQMSPPDHRVTGNAGNTYYFVYDTSSDTKAALVEAAGLGNEINVKSVETTDSSFTVPNVRKIDIGAKKTWAQDPDSAANDVQVAVRLMRSPNKDRSDAVPVVNQRSFIISQERLENYIADFSEGIGGSGVEAYILKKEDNWTQNVIWENLPNSDAETQQPYYYFVEEIAYKIGDTWYVPGEAGADYKPTYTDDAINSSGVIGIVNSSKLVVRKQWEDKDGNVITDPPVSSIDFNLYGIKSDGTEVKIILPEERQKLTAPNWEVEIPQHLINGEGMEYIRYRIEEVSEPEDYIVSDVYSFNGNVGVMYLINKNTNPTSVDVELTKTWADGNDAHGTDDAVTFTLYQFAGKQTVDQAFIESFISKGKTYNGVSVVNTVPNPVVLDGTESEPWKWEWKALPFRGGQDMNKLQYFVVEEQSDSTKDNYRAVYTLNGNSSFAAVRDLDVTNKQPGVLVVKKQWRDKTQADTPLIANANYDDITLKLYRKAASEPQVVDAEAEDIRTKYGLTDADLVTGRTDVEGLNSDGTITIGKDDRWTVSLSGLEEDYFYYVEETDGTGYQVSEYDPVYSNEGQAPGSENIITVDNFVEGERIKVKAVKNWDDKGTSVSVPDSVTFILEQYNGNGGTPVTAGTKVVTASDDWTAEWNDLPASKTYKIREEVPEGWIVTYEEVQITHEGENEETEVRNFTVKNTIDTGQLKVNKKWLGNDAGGTESVNVELWRQAYDENGEPVSETAPETQNTNGRFSSGRNMTSLRKVRKALAENNSSAAQEPLRAPRVTVKKVVEQVKRATYNSEIAIQQYTQSLVVNLDSSKTLVSVDVYFENASQVESLTFNLQNWGYGSDVTSQGPYVKQGRVAHWSYNVSGVGCLYIQPTGSDSLQNHIEKIILTYSDGSEYKIKNTSYTGVEQSMVINSINDPIAGDVVTLTTTDSTGTVTWSLVDSNGNPATYNYASITSGGVLTTSGTGTIYVKAQDSSSYATKEIFVSPFTINGKSGINTNQSEDAELTLSANASASWESSDTDVATVDSTTGKVTFIGNGDVTITATHGGASDSITFNVSSKPFSAKVEPETIHNGMTAVLSTDPTLTNVTWSLKNPEDADKVKISGNEVTAKCDNADVILVASRGTASDEVTLHIKPMLVTYNGGDNTPTNLTVGVNSSIPVVNVVGASSGGSSVPDVAWYDPDTHTVRTGEKVGTTIITIEDEGQTLTFTVNVEVEEAESNIPTSAEKVADITISADNNWWSSTLNNLPKTDGKGNTYRYFIKEEKTGNYIPVSYSTSQGGTPLNDGITNLELTNSSVESEEVELPEAGGQGTSKIYMAGGVIMLLAAAGYLYFKRRAFVNGV